MTLVCLFKYLVKAKLQGKESFHQHALLTTQQEIKFPKTLKPHGQV